MYEVPCEWNQTRLPKNPDVKCFNATSDEIRISRPIKNNFIIIWINEFIILLDRIRPFDFVYLNWEYKNNSNNDNYMW